MGIKIEKLKVKGLYDVLIKSPKGEEELKLYVYQEEKGTYKSDLYKGYGAVRVLNSELEPTKEQLEELVESYCVEDLELTDNYQWRATKRERKKE